MEKQVWASLLRKLHMDVKEWQEIDGWVDVGFSLLSRNMRRK